MSHSISMGTIINPLALSANSVNHEDKIRKCDWPSCKKKGEFRAPKTRNQIRSYHWLCLEHVRTYNKQWNYYAGMTEKEIEEDRKRDTLWDRATWPFGAEDQNYNTYLASPNFSKVCYNHHNNDLGFFETYDEISKPECDSFHFQEPSALSALDILGLNSPVTATEIKNNYKILVKRYHPDTNTEDPTAEEKFKELTKAYETLKTFFPS